MRGGRGGVVSPCGQPSRESTPPYAAINAASPAAECAHDASVSHRSLIQVFAIPGGDPARHPRLHARAMAIRTPRTALRRGRQTHPIPPIRPRPMDRRQHRLPGEMTGTRKSNVPDVYPMAKHPKNKRAESLKFRPFRSGRRDLNPRPAAASPRSSNHAGRSADAATTSSQPSGSAIPTPGSKRSTTRSRSPSAWPTASATRTTSSP